MKRINPLLTANNPTPIPGPMSLVRKGYCAQWCLALSLNNTPKFKGNTTNSKQLLDNSCWKCVSWSVPHPVHHHSEVVEWFLHQHKSFLICQTFLGHTSRHRTQYFLIYTFRSHIFILSCNLRSYGWYNVNTIFRWKLTMKIERINFRTVRFLTCSNFRKNLRGRRGWRLRLWGKPTFPLWTPNGSMGNQIK